MLENRTAGSAPNLGSGGGAWLPRQVSKALLNMVGAFFEDLSTLILGEVPLSTFSDWDERRPDGFASSDSGPFCLKDFFLNLPYVA